MSKWVQDAGHGGSDPGAVANGQQEKEWTLEAARYVDKRLGELGIFSHMTRTKDESLARNDRTTKVKKYDRCISHHYNAGGGTGAEFIHSIHSDGAFEDTLIEKFKAAGYPVRRKFTRKWGSRDYYYMHRETGDTQTTIVEYDFLDRPYFNKLTKKSYREGMYECVVQAICEEEGVEYKTSEQLRAEEEANQSGTFYRVVTGSFKDRDNAEKRMNELKNAGFDSFLDVFEK